MKTNRLAILLALSVALVCSCATRYQPAAASGGFSEAQIAADRFLIGFQGNGSSTLEQVYDFAMLHAAEVAHAHGFTCFAILDVTNTSSVVAYKVPGQSYEVAGSAGLSQRPPAPFRPPVAGYIGADSFANSQQTVMIQEPPEIREYARPGTLLVVKFFAMRPATSFTFDAAELEAKLKHKYKL